MIIVQRKRSSPGYKIPAGGEILWFGTAASLPSGWVIDSYCSNVFVKGAAQNGASNTPAGANSHQHTNPAATSTRAAHTHGISGGTTNSPGSTTVFASGGGGGYVSENHGHDLGGPSSSNGSHSHSVSAAVVADAYPPYKRLYWIKATVEVALPVGGIIMWDSPIAQRPNGCQICDGAVGTPDLRNVFVYGAAADGDVNATGGAETHVHANANTGAAGSHSHSFSYSSGGSSGNNTGVNDYASGVQVAAPNHSHGVSGTLSIVADHSHTVGNTGAGTSLPPYLKLYFVMRTE